MSEPSAGGHVHDVELAAGRLAPLDRPLDRLGLDEVGPGHRMEPGAVARHQLRRVMPRDQLVEHARRLRVHQEHGAVLPHLLERAEERAIVRLPSLRLVDHELLEGGEAALHHPRDLRLVLGVAGDADVEGVVDQRLPLGLPEPVVGGLAERFAGVGDGEVDHGGDAAPRARAGAGAVVVGRDGAAERQLEMDVHVEHAGQHVVAVGVDHVGARARLEVGAEGRDLLPRDADVADEAAGGGDDVAALDDAVEFHGRCASVVKSSARTLPPPRARHGTPTRPVAGSPTGRRCDRGGGHGSLPRWSTRRPRAARGRRRDRRAGA